MPPARDWKLRGSRCTERGVGDAFCSSATSSRGIRRCSRPLGHRAIGVVYRPKSERWGNYVPTIVPYRYDVMLYIDETSALRSAAHARDGDGGEEPETYPSGM